MRCTIENVLVSLSCMLLLFPVIMASMFCTSNHKTLFGNIETKHINHKLYSSKEKIYRWDLYGRVPHDDWLFSTRRLASPDLLKRSFPEMVSSSKQKHYTLQHV
jgi:hypothetical protein